MIKHVANKFQIKSNQGDKQMTFNEQVIKNINDFIKVIGKDGCAKMWDDMKKGMPEDYERVCKRFGRDLVEYINSL